MLAPIEGVRWPYHLYYLDHDETSIFGDGLASIMRDDQKMLNASIRCCWTMARLPQARNTKCMYRHSRLTLT